MFYPVVEKIESSEVDELVKVEEKRKWRRHGKKKLKRNQKWKKKGIQEKDVEKTEDENCVYHRGEQPHQNFQIEGSRRGGRGEWKRKRQRKRGG